MLLKKRIVTKISRNAFKLKLTVFRYQQVNLFKFGGLKKVPTDLKGRKLIKSRKSSKKFYYLALNNFKNVSWLPLLVVSIVYYQKFFKFISIVVANNGIVFSKILVVGTSLFSYFCFNKLSLPKSFFKSASENFLGFFGKKGKISNLELFNSKGFQYIKANGCFGKIRIINLEKSIVLVELPSKEIKIFSIFSVCSGFEIFFKKFRSLSFGDKRFKRFRGFGSKVRGVAMNSVDHPHGGNTKSIRFPRTPWGKPTKIK